MDSDRWKQLDTLLQLLLERPSEGRDTSQRHVCGGDETLERELGALLKLHHDAGSFLETPAIEVAARALARRQNEDAQEESDGPIARTISHYCITEKLG